MEIIKQKFNFEKGDKLSGIVYNFIKEKIEFKHGFLYRWGFLNNYVQEDFQIEIIITKIKNGN